MYEKKIAIFAKSNLYINEKARRVVARHIKKGLWQQLRKNWDHIDLGEIYPYLRPHEIGWVDAKIQLTPNIEKNFAKLNRKTKGRLSIQELAVEVEKA